MEDFNCYKDGSLAEAYSKLEFPGTYYLAFRDLPGIIFANVNGRKAVDFGCGTGRSTRFLKEYRFSAVGIDISAGMIMKAGETDPAGDYRLIGDCDLSQLKDSEFDLALSVFTFDNIPGLDKKAVILKELGRILNDNGRAVILVSSPEVYKHEWASFSTKDFPENKQARSGDKVRITITDIADKKPEEDILCTDDDYKRVFMNSGLELVKTYKPLANENEPYKWINEINIPPWIIYVLKKDGK